MNCQAKNGDMTHLNTGKIKIKENIDIFMCPVCEDRMYLDEFKSIICTKNHCFDISKKGYVNLHLKSSKKIMIKKCLNQEA